MRVHADNHPSKEFKGKSAAKYQYKDNGAEVDQELKAHSGTFKKYLPNDIGLKP
jgi:hypothetical protein